MNEIALTVQLSLGLVFLLAFSAKLLHPAEFLRGVEDYRLLPTWAARLVGAVLIPLEGFLAVAHLTGWALLAALPAGVLTLAIFVAAVGINLRQGRRVPCHCLEASGGEVISGRTLARIFLMLGGEALVISRVFPAAGDWSRWSFPHQVSAAGDLIHASMLACLLLAGAGWALKTPELLSLFRRTA